MCTLSLEAIFPKTIACVNAAVRVILPQPEKHRKEKGNICMALSRILLYISDHTNITLQLDRHGDPDRYGDPQLSADGTITE